MNISDLIAYIDTKLADNHKRLIIPSVHRDVLHYLVNGLNATVFNINSSQVTDNGDGTYTITVTNPLDDALAIDEKLNIYEYNGTNWVAKVVDLILSATGDDGVEIDDSDPNSIVVKLTQATLDSLQKADSAVQSVTGSVVDNTDPKNPDISISTDDSLFFEASTREMRSNIGQSTQTFTWNGGAQDFTLTYEPATIVYVSVNGQLILELAQWTIDVLNKQITITDPLDNGDVVVINYKFIITT